GFTAWKLAKGLYLVPLLFVYGPLISGSWTERLEAFAWACLGLYALCGLLQWHLGRPLNIVTALLLALGAVLLLWVPLGFWMHVLGALLLAGVIGWQRRAAVPATGEERAVR